MLPTRSSHWIHRAWPTWTGFALASIVAAFALLAPRAVLAEGGAGEEPMAPSGSGSGGGSVGSLPSTAPPPPTPTSTTASAAGASGTQTGLGVAFDPARPVLSLVGRESDIRRTIVAAYGNGHVEIQPLGAGDKVRMTFFGDVTVELARGKLHTSFIAVQIVVGSSFQGGRATIAVDGQVRTRHMLAKGAIDMRLHQLSQSGLTDLGVVWNAVSRSRERASIAVDSSAGVIRIQQGD